MPLHHDTSTSAALDSLFSTTSEKVGGVISAAMISSPLWIQHLKPYSDAAALFAPILGCVYLSMQIGFKLWDRTRSEE